MIKEFFRKSDAFVSAVRDVVEQSKRIDALAQFSCSIDVSYEIVSELHSGRRHSKAPAHGGWKVTTRLNGRFSDGKSFSLEYTGMCVSEFVRCYRNACILAATLKHKPHFEKHKSYPKVELASAELMAILEDPAGSSRVDEIAVFLDSTAERVRHPRIMARESRVMIGSNKRVYFDGVNNFAEEFSTECDLSVAYMLSDSIESHSDSFGHLPTPTDIERVVADAARNLTLHDVLDFEGSDEPIVVLTPKAVVTLMADIVLPNLSARVIMDGTGAWGLDDLNEVVLAGVTLRDNPLVEYSPYSHLFDVEGTPASEVEVLKNGKLAHPLLTATLLAELLATAPQMKGCFHLTGHAVGTVETSFTNLQIEISARTAETFEDMVDGAPMCVVVNNLTGMSADPLTGQFALDAEGARVYKDGKLAYSTSITLRGNFFEAIADPANFAGPVERVLNVYAPSLRTRKLSCVARKMAQED